jgi:hypothetical protein
VKHLCECGCGRPTSIAKKTNKTFGHIKGQPMRYVRGHAREKHGHSRKGNHTATYNRWRGMIQRCTNPRNPTYTYYGGRGITVCDRWLEFENFLADMGECPDGLFLNRIDNRGYEPGNCRYTTERGRNPGRAERQNREATEARRRGWPGGAGVVKESRLASRA